MSSDRNMAFITHNSLSLCAARLHIMRYLGLFDMRFNELKIKIKETDVLGEMSQISAHLDAIGSDM